MAKLAQLRRGAHDVAERNDSRAADGLDDTLCTERMNRKRVILVSTLLLAVPTCAAAGIDTGTVSNPTAPENRPRTSGRGIYLMKAFMDEVRVERAARLYINARNPTAPQPLRLKRNDANSSNTPKFPTV